MPRTLSGALLLAALLAACTASPAAPTSQVSPTGLDRTAEPTGTATEAPTEAATEAPSGGNPPQAPSVAIPTDGAFPTDGAQPSVSFIPDQALEDLFPDDLGGQPLQVQSASGPGVVQFFNGTDPARLNEFLASLDRTIDDMSAAIAFTLIMPSSPDPEASPEVLGATIVAFRVQGADSMEVRARFADLVIADAPGSTTEETTIAGKPVLAVTAADAEEGESVYLYAVGDVVFMVGGSPTLVEEAFTKLP
jgi:hypothetical protein